MVVMVVCLILFFSFPKPFPRCRCRKRTIGSNKCVKEGMNLKSETEDCSPAKLLTLVEKIRKEFSLTIMYKTCAFARERAYQTNAYVCINVMLLNLREVTWYTIWNSIPTRAERCGMSKDDSSRPHSSATRTEDP
uniref:Putative secreted protein n=1 Tax=Anopheles darlingi TaxID=43151 RepID=A0A2M4D8T4_ANODA